MCGLKMMDRCAEMIKFAGYGDEHDRKGDIQPD